MWDGPGDDRLSRRSTIMGPAGLTAVFEMGTGVAPPVWSPGSRPGSVSAPRPGGSATVVVTGQVGRGVGPSGLRSSQGIREGVIPGPGPVGIGSGWSSRLAVRTGRLRWSPTVHIRPIDLVIFQEPSRRVAAGNLILERASRLDAFSAYPIPTWLPGGAPSGTAGTPEVGPPQSSRTRGDPPQVSSARGR